MAGEYGVNINLRVKGQSGLDRLNAKVKELSKSVDNIRQIDIMNPRNTGGAAGKGARNDLKKYKKDMDDIVKSVNKAQGAFGKTANQQMAAADALEEYANSLTIGTKAHKEALAASVKQNTAIGRETNSIIKNTDAQIKNNKAQAEGNKLNKFDNRSNKAALTSGLISGAFPLLFGQGPLGGAFGFAGGFAGTKIGGQMGGFAGGLVATAVLQQITTLVDGINKLGNAFNEIEPDINQLTISLGISGTMEEKRLQIIARSKGAHVALAMATEQMNKEIGEQGVQNLKEFAKSSRLLGNSFALAMTKMQAALAPFFKFFADMAGGVTGAKQKERERLLGLGEGAGGSDVSRLATLREELAGINSTKQNRAKINRLKAEIAAIEERLIKEGESIDLANTRQLLFEEATKSIEDQNNFLQNQILLGQRGAEIEKLKLDTAKAMKISVEDLTADQIKNLENLIKTRDELKLLNDLYKGIANTVQTGLVNAIDGAINRTMTLGEVAASVFRSIQRQLINFAATSLLRAIPGFGGFFANGGVTKPNKSYIVGEKGPELFTPGVTGKVTANHELGGGSTNVVVNVDASGTSVEGDEQSAAQFGEAIAAAIQAEIVNQKMAGGLLS